MKNNEQPKSEILRKLASEVRDYAKKVEEEKTVKCAKYVVGLTALAQLQSKLRSL